MWTEMVLRRVAFGCAVFMLLGIVTPTMFTRASWLGKRGSIVLTDSPAGYVGLVSVFGLVALGFLIVAVWWRRMEIGAALVAAASFAAGAWVAGTYWQGLRRGVALLEGRSEPGAGYTLVPPPGPPFYRVAAIVGLVSALALAVHWRHPERSKGRVTPQWPEPNLGINPQTEATKPAEPG